MRSLLLPSLISSDNEGCDVPAVVSPVDVAKRRIGPRVSDEVLQVFLSASFGSADEMNNLTHRKPALLELCYHAAP